MKGKIFTIAGIFLIFGYFISESFKNDSSDPTQVVIVGGDTLGRDWGAMADQKALEASEAMNSISSEDKNSSNDAASKFYNNDKSLLNPNEDPYSREKLNSSNYSTVQDGSGREIITGYNRPEEQENLDPYSSRHAKERNQNRNEDQNEEPQIQYRQ